MRGRTKAVVRGGKRYEGGVRGGEGGERCEGPYEADSEGRGAV